MGDLLSHILVCVSFRVGKAALFTKTPFLTKKGALPSLSSNCPHEIPDLGITLTVSEDVLVDVLTQYV